MKFEQIIRLNSTKILLFALLNLLAISITSKIQAADTCRVNVRQPETGFVEKYTSQKEFIYLNPIKQQNFLQEIFKYIIQKSNQIKQIIKALPIVFEILFWISVLLLIFVIITKTKIYKIFYTNHSVDRPDFIISQKQDQDIDFDAIIRQNIDKQLYREAIRFQFLKLMGQLQVKGFISYSKEKTNLDYLIELKTPELKSQFRTATSIYNHVWYGEFEIVKTQYNNFEQRFQSFYNLIDVQK